jgi:hypothetical protein
VPVTGAEKERTLVVKTTVAVAVDAGMAAAGMSVLPAMVTAAVLEL